MSRQPGGMRTRMLQVVKRGEEEKNRREVGEREEVSGRRRFKKVSGKPHQPITKRGGL